MGVGSHLHVLTREQFVRRPLAVVFGFFANAANLERLNPPFLNVRILTPMPIEMRAGALIEYRLRLFGVSLRWKTMIESYEPGHRFVDVQLRGPYKVWRHEHEFEPLADGTLVRDRVTYSLPFGALGELVRASFMDRMLERIFDYRAKRIEQLEQ